MSEKLIALFEGQDLSEEVKAKITESFDAAVDAKATAIKEDYDQKLEEEKSRLAEEKEKEIAEHNENLTEAVDAVLNDAIKEWAIENAVAVEGSVKVEIAESMLTGMKSLFETHNVVVPDAEERSQVAEAQAETAEIQTKLDEEAKRRLNTEKELSELRQALVFKDVAESLTDSQVEKFQDLVEDVEFVSAEGYREKISSIKEAHFKLDEEVETGDELKEEEAPKGKKKLSPLAEAAVGSFANKSIW